MARRELHPLSRSPVTNNCPECFNQDLTITFFQTHLKGAFLDRVTSEVTPELRCNTCGTVIYPVSWTDDIERSVGYYQKALNPEKTRIRFRPLFYLAVLLGLLLAGALIYLFPAGAS
jgi:ribosomal protein S27E